MSLFRLIYRSEDRLPPGTGHVEALAAIVEAAKEQFGAKYEKLVAGMRGNGRGGRAAMRATAPGQVRGAR